jgi:sugar phosphate isomerase/epimerase
LLPEEYGEKGFRQTLDLLQGLGFSGIELNVVRPEAVDPVELKALLAQHGLQMTMFASGATANAEGLFLSHLSERTRSASVRRCITLLDFAAEMEAGIIIGFLKGPSVLDREGALAQFRKSIDELAPHALSKQVPCLIEATNHYETSVVRTLQEGAEILAGHDNPFLRLLPDTYHMNIEERSMMGALVRYSNLYDNLHISDNNRFFPGLGAIDFAALVRFLLQIGYGGGLAIEGNVRESFERDLRASMRYLEPILRGVWAS